MKKALVLVVAALLLPGAALAKGKPPHPSHGSGAGGSKSHSAPRVNYVLKGTLSGYQAYDSSTSTDGSITILVKRANHHGKALENQTLTFRTDAKTKISLSRGSTGIADDSRGIVTVRAAKKIADADLAAALQGTPARQVVAKSPSS
jgi:hypothetical protein